MKDFEKNYEAKQRIISVSSGRESADTVLKNAAYVNVFSNELCTGDIAVFEGTIVGIGQYSGRQELDMSGKIICPGFIDAHIHIESALVSPVEFVKATLPHGTTSVITDPHEIANVMGADGIEYMLEASENLPVDVYFMLPSCVPATKLDEAGAVLNYREIDSFYDNPRVLGLAEMMDYDGVVEGDEDVLKKLTAAQTHGARIDGHAPGLRGSNLNAYVASGVSSDHECSELEEAMEKLRRGQFILIREGTAARNLEALSPLLTGKCADRCMFCTDDKHPNDLLEKGHIDYIIKKAISLGVDPIAAVKAASFTAAQHFRLDDRGAIAPGYAANLVVIDNFVNFGVEKVFKNGELLFDGKMKDFTEPKAEERLLRRAHNSFNMSKCSPKDFADERALGLIGLIPQEIVTNDCGFADGIDIQKDILKIAVIERHKNTGHIGLGYIKGYGLKTGAVATSVSHDSHNVIALGTSDEEIAAAANRVLQLGGGIVVMKEGKVLAELALPLAGIMSGDTLENVNSALENAKDCAYALGVSEGIDPFMTLSFMSLPVIPALRLTTHGVYDVIKGKLV